MYKLPEKTTIPRMNNHPATVVAPRGPPRGGPRHGEESQGVVHVIPYARLEYFQIGGGHSVLQPMSAEGPHDHPDQRRNRAGHRKKSLHDLLSISSFISSLEAC